MTNNDQSPALIDLNQASVKTLATLPGIGPKLAARIVQFRREVRPFTEAIEVTSVPGISERMYRQFADRVTVVLTDEVTATPSPPDVAGSRADDWVAEEEGFITSGVEAKEIEAKPHKPKDGKKKEEKYYVIVTDEEEEVELEAEAEREAEQPMATARAEERIRVTEDVPSSRLAASSFRRPWLLMVVGALLGAFLALALLYSVNNGVLIFANHPKIVEFEAEISALKQREASLQGELDDLRQILNQYAELSTRQQKTEAEIQVLKQARDTLTAEVATLDERASILDEQVATLEESGRQMQGTIEQLQADTGRFDEFLTGLRDLLLAIQGAPASSPPATGTGEASPTPANTSTPEPSRTATPRPTATATPASGN